MKETNTRIHDVKIIQPAVYGDARGFLVLAEKDNKGLPLTELLPCAYC